MMVSFRGFENLLNLDTSSRPMLTCSEVFNYSVDSCQFYMKAVMVMLFTHSIIDYQNDGRMDFLISYFFGRCDFPHILLLTMRNITAMVQILARGHSPPLLCMRDGFRPFSFPPELHGLRSNLLILSIPLCSSFHFWVPLPSEFSKRAERLVPGSAHYHIRPRLHAVCLSAVTCQPPPSLFAAWQNRSDSCGCDIREHLWVHVSGVSTSQLFMFSVLEYSECKSNFAISPCLPCVCKHVHTCTRAYTYTHSCFLL